MLTLFYSPGACSMASHIGLEESGAAFELKPVALAKGEQQTPDYLKVNPRGKVPALRLEDGSVLTENTAILSYLGLRFPEKGLLPKENDARARCISMMAWLSNSVHPAFTHIFRPERFSADPGAHPSIKEMGKKTFWAALQEIDGIVAGSAWKNRMIERPAVRKVLEREQNILLKAA
jgi:glutathione S-transferase